MGIVLAQLEPWAPHPTAAPVTSRSEELLAIAANGTRTSCGGWQARYTGINPGDGYCIRADVHTEGVSHQRDCLQCVAIWGQVDPHQPNLSTPWDYLPPRQAGDGSVSLAGQFVAPEDATCLTLRYTLRRTATGRSTWSLPKVIGTSGLTVERGPVKVAVVTGHAHQRRGLSLSSPQDNVRFYTALCNEAGECGARLMVLPEIAVNWGISGHPIDLACLVPGPETDEFSAVARAHSTYILVGLYERDGDAVYNSAVLLGPDGKVVGTYRKVHLASGGESTSGIAAGESFPVFQTDIGRMGCNICMDGSAIESSRLIGLHGADFLLLPIMGDHRADRFSVGNPIFHEDRWRAIMRTRAMDNQFCMVVARNEAQGSCVIDRKGDILAWNEGDRKFILADVDLAAGFRSWNGGCFRGINWMQRRPHLYSTFTDEFNAGSLD
jgi:predicted amidohydrolase